MTRAPTVPKKEERRGRAQWAGEAAREVSKLGVDEEEGERAVHTRIGGGGGEAHLEWTGLVSATV